MSSASRLALIAALACKGVASVKSTPPVYTVPQRCQGSRASLADAALTPGERARVAEELAQAKRAKELAFPVNFVLVGKAY